VESMFAFFIMFSNKCQRFNTFYLKNNFLSPSLILVTNFDALPNKKKLFALPLPLLKRLPKAMALNHRKTKIFSKKKIVIMREWREKDEDAKNECEKITQKKIIMQNYEVTFTHGALMK
jgi:hypothetical protein